VRRRDLLLGVSAAALSGPAAAQPVPFAPGVFGRMLGPVTGGGLVPTLDLNFINGAALDSRVTFSRADTVAAASYFDATGTMRYGPTNIMTQSQDMTAWTLTNVTATLASGTAPDGANTMNRIAETATTSTHYINRNIAVVASTVYTVSIYAKAAERQYLQLNYDDGTNGAVATFDLVGGTITGALAARGSGTAIGAAITAIGNGIYRCSITASHGSTTGRMLVSLAITANPAVAPSYAGNASNGLLVWGAQMEANTAPGPYVATVAAALSGPRFDYGPGGNGGITNYIRNSVASGANGATPPTYWGFGGSANGITLTYVGAATDAQGLPAYDFTLAGTCTLTTTGTGLLQLDGSTQIPASNGQTWTLACNMQVVSGALNGLTIGVDTAERTLAGGFVVGHATNVSPTGTMVRYSSSATFNGGVTTAFVLPILRWNLTNGQTINVTIRVSQPQLEQAASAGTYVPTSGMALNSGATPKGLLMEEARSNLHFPSNALATLLTVTATTVTAAQGNAPDGTLTMARIAEDATTAVHVAYKLNTVTASAIYTFSIFAQAQQNRYMQLIYDDGSANGLYAVFDLTGGTVTQGPTARGTGTATGAAIQSVGTGIYRCSITGVCAASTSARCGIILCTSATPGYAPSYAGNASNGLLLWGSQLEAAGNGVPTSYIPTVGASVTRGSDNATMALAPPAVFSIATEFILPILGSVGALQGFVVVDDGTINNRVSGRVGSSTPQAASVVANVATASATSNAITANTIVKTAFVSNGNAATITLALNGVATAAGSGAQPTGLTTLRIGINNVGSNWGNGWARRMRYYPSALNAAQLVQITT
jgi:hypothetical protein